MHAVKQHHNGANGRASRLRDEDSDPFAGMYDLELEREVLAAFLTFPDLIVPSEVATSSFHSAAHETAFAAILKLLADGELEEGGDDSVSREISNTQRLRGALLDLGKLASVGGDDFVHGLTSGIPHRLVDTTRLRRLACRRRVHNAARLVQARAGSDDLANALATLNLAQAELEAVDRVEKRIPTLAELIPRIEQRGPRLQTGIESLDNHLRGGIPLGRVVTIVGAPGASKTNFGVWLADKWERVGCAIGIIASDEAREQVITRLGQLAGFDRDLLEGEDPGRRNAFIHAARSRSIMVIDPSEDDCSLEEAEKQLIEFARGKPRVLLIDSIQTVWCQAADQEDTTREQIEAVVATIKAIAARGTLVLSISEMTRAGYRTGKRDQDTGALSSAAETRKIEYDSHLLLGLRPVKGENGAIDIETGKNRIGTDKPEFRVRVDFSSLQFREIQRPADETAEVENKRTVELRQRVVAELVKNPATHKTRESIQRAVGARKSAVGAVVKELIEDGSIEKVGGFFRAVVTPC